MRLIKFRGKEIETNQWVYGDLLQCPEKYPTIRMWEEAYPIARSVDFVVIPETLGQFTGLHDKHGKEIYEWDVLKENNTSKYLIEWRAEIASFVMRKNLTDQWYDIEFAQHIKIVGNIHDNPKLLKGGEE